MRSEKNSDSLVKELRMINLCTVSDKNYLTKGITLLESLRGTTDGFCLHYLCIDDKSYEILNKYVKYGWPHSHQLKVYHVKDFVEKDLQLKALQDDDYKYFCWSLASYFTNHLMDELQSDITYIDSDIYFHRDFERILGAIGSKDVGVFRHRQFPLNVDHPSGKFNVGVVHFKNTEMGKHLLDWWADAVLNKKYPDLATCGDQRYLDMFYKFSNCRGVFIDGDVGHGAPWQWQLYDMSEYENTGAIIWNGIKQDLIFTHFSQFEHTEDSYIPSTMHHCYTPLEHYKTPGLKYVYDEYFSKIKHSMDEIAAVGVLP